MSHPRRFASNVPTHFNLPARVSRPRGVCSSHRAADEASHLHYVCPRQVALRLSAGYWFAGSIPVPSQHRTCAIGSHLRVS
jgi:hypothetical protein